MLEGVNVSVFLYGASESGKSHTMEGGKGGADPGLVPLLADNLFAVLDEKRYQNRNYSFQVRIKYVEVLDEEVYDLLQPGGGHAFHRDRLRLHEWEGPQVQGVQWVSVPSAQYLKEFFRGGAANKTSRSNEFGPMRDKAAQLFQIELSQNVSNNQTGENQVTVSRVNVVSLPGCEVLNEDPEALRIR